MRLQYPGRQERPGLFAARQQNTSDTASAARTERHKTRAPWAVEVILNKDRRMWKGSTDELRLPHETQSVQVDDVGL